MVSLSPWTKESGRNREVAVIAEVDCILRPPTKRVTMKTCNR